MDLGWAWRARMRPCSRRISKPTAASGYRLPCSRISAQRRSSRSEMVVEAAQDTLIFRVTGDRLTLVGGSGRGVGWSGVVDLPLDGEPYASRATKRGLPVQIAGEDPIRVVGPYWNRQAVLVPVGNEHPVVFGGLESPDPSAYLSGAAELVAELQQVSPSKLLADELEVVHAIRDLMEYRPEELAATARHIAAKPAEPPPSH